MDCKVYYDCSIQQLYTIEYSNKFPQNNQLNQLKRVPVKDMVTSCAIDEAITTSPVQVKSAK